MIVKNVHFTKQSRKETLILPKDRRRKYEFHRELQKKRREYRVKAAEITHN